ncbi:MAG: hypothetical protein KDJ78_00450 [Rhodobacteraceae bacterium]|uniref:hypothetical protein n=1 Tax=Amaricoccus sp. TaxID=1872485 RepID=UPI001E080AA3|nr:hypothetical protein [Amaricoccus sp.]MCB1372649.1 hypothetical protein [Paracoccaceae bacterium]MCB1401365.1 hypothetical protein [Paracoccaceae bacterium]HRW15333.1 hypothetical protein [Amaricoccus sp.]
MSAAVQKRLALIGAFAALTLVLAANAHLLAVAFHSQPACVATEGTAMPARRAC